MILRTQKELSAAKHVDGLKFQCSQCGEIKPVQTSGGTGYGYATRAPDALPICYACCAENDRKEMRTAKRFLLYLTHKGEQWEVTNWPGTLRFPARVSIGHHNIAKRRYDVHFMAEGRQWYGVTIGDQTQICHCRALKGKA